MILRGTSIKKTAVHENPSKMACLTMAQLLALKSIRHTSNGNFPAYFSKLCGKIFTTAEVDNINHNPSSTTANDSFHGTAISLVQHPTTSNKDNDWGIHVLNETEESQKKDSKTSWDVYQCSASSLASKEPFAPPVIGPLKPSLDTPEGNAGHNAPKIKRPLWDINPPYPEI